MSSSVTSPRQSPREPEVPIRQAARVIQSATGTERKQLDFAPVIASGRTPTYEEMALSLAATTPDPNRDLDVLRKNVNVARIF